MRNINIENIKHCKVCKDQLVIQVNSTIKHCVNCGETYSSAKEVSNTLKTTLNKLIDFLNEEICERRDYTASKMCEVIRLKIETELLEEEKEIITKAYSQGRVDEETRFPYATDEVDYYNLTFGDSNEADA